MKAIKMGITRVRYAIIVVRASRKRLQAREVCSLQGVPRMTAITSPIPTMMTTTGGVRCFGSSLFGRFI